MGENRDKTYPIRMNEEELRIAKEVAKKIKLPDMVRDYIRKLHDEHIKVSSTPEP